MSVRYDKEAGYHINIRWCRLTRLQGMERCLNIGVCGQQVDGCHSVMSHIWPDMKPGVCKTLVLQTHVSAQTASTNKCDKYHHKRHSMFVIMIIKMGGDILDLYLAGIWFKFRLGYQLSC